MGATAVLETAAEIPPKKKSVTNLEAPLYYFLGYSAINSIL
jgi:hypothetical protein